jgi:hypothetical protein
MPQQETYFEQQVGDKHIIVLKSYDGVFAREAFDRMGDEALQFLSSSLEHNEKYDAAEVPSPEDPEFADALWQEVEDGAREDWNTFSYFIVSEEIAGRTVPLYVSSDWPSAEVFAKRITAP